MKQLELEIPPPLVFLLCAILMIVLNLLAPQIPFKPWFRSIAPALAVLSLILGIITPISAIRAFRKAKTTISPTKPNKTSTIVTSGVYRVTRNPMYLGLFFYCWPLGYSYPMF